MRGIERDTKEGQEWQQEGEKTIWIFHCCWSMVDSVFSAFCYTFLQKIIIKNRNYDTQLIREMQVGCIYLRVINESYLCCPAPFTCMLHSKTYMLILYVHTFDTNNLGCQFSWGKQGTLHFCMPIEIYVKYWWQVTINHIEKRSYSAYLQL